MLLLISIPIKISFANQVERERQKKESTSLSISGVTHAHVVGRRAGGRTRTYSSFLLTFQFGQPGVVHHLKGLPSPSLVDLKGTNSLPDICSLSHSLTSEKMFRGDKTPGFVLLYHYGSGFKVDWLHLKRLYMVL